MAIWTVWEHERHGAEGGERAVFVKDGFSWLAFLFGPLWLLWHRMWVVFVLYCVVMVGVPMLVERFADPRVAAIVGFGLGVWFAFEARGLRRWSLARRGWTLMAVVEGRRFRNAERRYFSDRPFARAPLAPAAWRDEEPQVVGVFPEPAR
jgi:hypothetical protein